MSIFGGNGVGRGRGPVPQAPTADNRKLDKDKGTGAVIKRVYWGQDRAGLSDSVPIVIELALQPFDKAATVEIFYHGGTAKPHLFGTPISVTLNGMTGTGAWTAIAPRMKEYTKGHFTFRAKVDGHYATSDALKLTDDPVARVMRRINTDGFEPGR